jgi:ribonuclease Z
MEGSVWDGSNVSIRVAATDHRAVESTIAFRLEYDGASVVLAGEGAPCATVDAWAAGANALVHTVIRKDLVALSPQQRVRDILDCHSSVDQAGPPRRGQGSAR